jgi:DNA-directed RNA polymerase subunit M/transcription elongation factor TFIIS
MMERYSVSELRTFFRFCPSCGRRFHIKLIGKEVVEVDRVPGKAEKPMMVSNQISGYDVPMPVLLEEGKPVMIDLEEYSYTYRCKHCGHEWTEKHIEEEQEH